MDWDDTEVVIVGTGDMAASLAQAFAQNNLNVGLVGRSNGGIDRAFQYIQMSLEEACQKGVFSSSQAEEVRGRILGTTQFEEACGGRNLRLVVESAREDVEVKKEIFRKLDKFCSPRVVLATNTSSLDAQILASETLRPDKVAWMHFFYPAHKNKAAEYAGTKGTSPETVQAASWYMKSVRKEAVPLLRYRKGGAANIILVGLILEAVRMAADGFDVPSIEAAGMAAFSAPAGFLTVMDAGGISLALSCIDSFSDKSRPGDPLVRVYDNFFTLPGKIRQLLEGHREEKRRASFLLAEAAGSAQKPADIMVLDTLKRRFFAVAFMTATEVVDAGIIDIAGVEKLCRIAFGWQEGPFTLMNKAGIGEALGMVTERMELSHSKEVNFPVPRLLLTQAQKNEPWPLEDRLIS